MKWRTHAAIAMAVSRSLNLPREWERALSWGSIEPDKHSDRVLKVGRGGRVYTARAPHHNPPLDVVMGHVWRARLAYLRGDYRRAMRSLGRALHYVQDKCVSKGFLGLSHGRREWKLLDRPIPRHAIERGLSIAVCSPHFIKKCVRSLKPSKDPEEILEQACMYSAAIAKAVMGARTPPRELVESYKSARERHQRRILPVAIGALGVGLLASAVARNPLFAVLGALAGYLIHRLDLKYHYLREEAKWFGIEE